MIKKRLLLCLFLIFLNNCTTTPVNIKSNNSGSEIKTPTPTPTSSLTPTPSSLPTPTPTPSPITGTVTGLVKDEDGYYLTDVEVKAESLDEKVKYTENVKIDSYSRYKLRNVPLNIPIKVTAYKIGYNSKTLLTSVSDPNKTVDLDFIDTASLSNKPEVIRVYPEHLSKNVSPNTYIQLDFSTSMDKNSVEKAFAIISNESKDISLKCAIIPGTMSPNNTVYNIEAFTKEWLSDTSLKLTFNKGYYLPTSSSTSNLITYRVILNYKGNIIQDSNGIKSKDPNIKPVYIFEDSYGPFVIDNTYRAGFIFTVSPDTVPPKIESVVAVSNSGYSEDKIYITFSETMYLRGKDFDIGGGAQGDISSAPAGTPKVNSGDAAKNYILKVNGVQQNISRAELDPTEFENNKVILSCPPGTFNKGDKIELIGSSSIVDPAGNSLISETIETFVR